MGMIRLGSKPPLTVAPGDSVREAALAMTGRRVGAAVVVDGSAVLGVWLVATSAPMKLSSVSVVSRS